MAEIYLLVLTMPQTDEPEWMRDFEEKQAAKETATKLKVTNGFHFHNNCILRHQESVERKLRRKERVKKLKELYGPSAKQWMKRKVSVLPCLSECFN